MVLQGVWPRVSPAATGEPGRAGARRATGWPRCAAALLALALAGCDGASTGAPQPTGSPASSSASAATGTPTASETPAPSETPTPGGTSGTAAPSRNTTNETVTLVRSGGIAGLTETITVQPDGKWQRGNGRSVERTGRLTSAQLSKLKALAADPRLDAEADRLAPGTNRCNDAFTYLLNVDSKLIRYEQCGQGEPPKVTMEIVTLLQSATSG